MYKVRSSLPFRIDGSTDIGSTLPYIDFEIYLGTTLIYSGRKNNYQTIGENRIELDLAPFFRDFIVPKEPYSYDFYKDFSVAISLFGLGYENAQPFSCNLGFVLYEQLTGVGTFDYNELTILASVDVMLHTGRYDYPVGYQPKICIDSRDVTHDITWKNLDTLTTVTYTNTGSVALLNAVHDSMLDAHVELDINGLKYYFKPINECKYEPIQVDYINDLGGWQTTFLYKANFESLQVSGEKLHRGFNSSTYLNGDSPIKAFNVDSKKIIKGNTGWVNDDFNQNTLFGLMHSETILINGLPYLLKTQNIDFTKKVNEKLINYTLEFEQAFNTIFR